MSRKLINLIKNGFLLFFLTNYVHAADNNRVSAGVGLSKTRVIYHSENNNGNVLRVNNPNEYPVLVKSAVLDETMRKQAPFIITPPLFRLEAGQSNILNIIRTGGDFPSDRETVNLICVESIPPVSDDKPSAPSGDMSVKILIKSCIKMFYRPELLRGNPVSMADNVSWKITGHDLTGSNPSPFFINIREIYFNGEKLNMEKNYIPPFSETSFSLSAPVRKGTLKWTVIGDYGESREKTTVVK
ncbi:molecular chaperone [Salmonella enterica]|nr:molecular chaperone [Salmonella enterica]